MHLTKHHNCNPWGMQEEISFKRHLQSASVLQFQYFLHELQLKQQTVLFWSLFN